ncbi:cytochrome c oxidase subunit 2A [Thermus albus]|nr:cytochrome c oxidase subunit 2A [Thermus albus]
MEEKPVGAMGVIVVLTLTILVFWLGVYFTFFARG